MRAANVRGGQGREDVAHPSRTELCDMLYRDLRTPAALDLFLALDMEVMAADIPNCLQDPIPTRFKRISGKVYDF